MKQFSIKSGFLLLLLLSAFQQGFTQNNQDLIQQFLNENREKLELTQKDISDWVITDQHTGDQSGITYVYIRQRHQGIEVYNGVANFNIKDGKVLSMGDRLIRKLATRVNTINPGITPVQAIQKAAEQLNLTITEQISALEPVSLQHFVFSNAGISKENIPVKLMYQPDPEGELFLAWNLSIYQKDAQHWWSLRVDAQSGTIIDKADWVLKCSFPDGAFGKCNNPAHNHTSAPMPTPSPSPTTTTSTVPLPDQYRVFATPLESPNHGSRTLEIDPRDSLASPYGWHDTNAATGAEFTITRGNNVFAYEDTDDDDLPGYSPNGTAALNFDFPLNLSQAPANYFDPAITNLFYWNNTMHDVWYRYGFTEAAGNFQENNYGRGGAGSDYVYAEAQDGGGTNNANFATPDDGSHPRMQMYLWTAGGGISNLLTVNSPAGVAGAYAATEAVFGPGVPSSPLTANLELVVDNTAPTDDGCETITNGGALTGKIAVVYRGSCNFTVKVAAAQAAGAIAVIVINNAAGAPINMGGTDPTITIPSVMISDVDGAAIVAAMGSGPVNGTLVNSTGNFDKDGDLDNGIIAHEYGHGISNRLTGGPSNSNCLNNAEQMGEGWSDFVGLMLTIEPGDTATDIRGIGTYATGEPVTGGGIREAPYTTNMTVNPYTYADVSNNVSQPHGIGFVWCSMLWDLNWAMINQYGFDPDLYTGTGGNNMTMRLVVEGMKLQVCSPGFVDGRDAILLADQQLYGGVNQCLIWAAFARRGLGYSASQGSSGSRTDQTEAFDLPPSCQVPTSAPVAAFSSALLSSCSSVVNFTDASTNVPQSWSWSFGDGDTSNLQNPSHTYSGSGTYTVTLTVGNTLGNSTTTQTVIISLPVPPTVNGASICSGQSATLSGTVPGGNTIIWYDASGTTGLDTALFYTTPTLTSSTTYMAANAQFFPSQNVGPTNNTSAGGMHGNATPFYINFEAFKAFTLVSVSVNANTAGVRTINVYNAYNGGGTLVTTVTPNIPAVQGRVTLNIAIPGPGQYSIGIAQADMFRSNSGITYPYAISGLVSLNSSSAGTAGYYYYLYDWEVQEAPCLSAQVPVSVGVNGANFSSAANGLTVQFTDMSVGGSSWAWDFGDGNTSTAQNPSHTYATAGTYSVTLTVNGNTTCPYTANVTVNFTGVVQTNDLEVTLTPNPSKTQSNLSFGQALTEDLQVQIIAVDGRVVQELIVRAGESNKTLDVSNLAPAMYLVRLNNAKHSQTLKLTVE